MRKLFCWGVAVVVIGAVSAYFSGSYVDRHPGSYAMRFVRKVFQISTDSDSSGQITKDNRHVTTFNQGGSIFGNPDKGMEDQPFRDVLSADPAISMTTESDEPPIVVTLPHNRVPGSIIFRDDSEPSPGNPFPPSTDSTAKVAIESSASTPPHGEIEESEPSQTVAGEILPPANESELRFMPYCHDDEETNAFRPYAADAEGISSNQADPPFWVNWLNFFRQSTATFCPSQGENGEECEKGSLGHPANYQEDPGIDFQYPAVANPGPSKRVENRDLPMSRKRPPVPNTTEVRPGDVGKVGKSPF